MADAPIDDLLLMDKTENRGEGLTLGNVGVSVVEAVENLFWKRSESAASVARVRYDEVADFNRRLGPGRLQFTRCVRVYCDSGPPIEKDIDLADRRHVA